jgi:hypothetical protein
VATSTHSLFRSRSDFVEWEASVELRCCCEQVSIPPVCSLERFSNLPLVVFHTQLMDPDMVNTEGKSDIEEVTPLIERICRDIVPVFHSKAFEEFVTSPGLNLAHVVGELFEYLPDNAPPSAIIQPLIFSSIFCMLSHLITQWKDMRKTDWSVLFPLPSSSADYMVRFHAGKEL